MRRYKVLIIDDEPITRMDLKEMLADNKFEVIGEGKNGNEAIEKAHLLNPDIIIMDVKMPEMNGVKAASIIKSFSDCAILLLTAYSDQEIIDDAKKASINAYLVKPIKETDLIPALEIALSQRDKFRSLTEQMKKTEQKITDRIIIEKAKHILIKQLDCSEEHAYRQMRQLSMSNQIPLSKLAQKIIDRVN